MTPRLFLKNTTFMISSKVLNLLLGTLSTMLFARTFGSQLLGQLTFTLAVSSVFANFSNFGMDLHLVKEISRRKEGVTSYISHALILKGVLTAVMVTFYFIYPQSQYRTFFLVVGIGNFLYFASIPFRSLLQAKERFDVEAILNSATSGMLLVAIAIISFLGLPIDYYMWTYLGIHLTVLLVAVYSSHSLYYYKIQKTFDKTTLVYIIRKAGPLAISGIFSIAYFNAAGILIKYLMNEQSLGYYAAAYKLLQPLLIVPMMLSRVLLPIFSKAFSQDTQLFKKTATHAYRIAIVIIALVVITIFLLSGPLITMLYGSEFSSATVVLQILIWTLIIYTVNNIIGNALISAEREVVSVTAVVTGTIFNILISIILIPIYGIKGAAIAAVLTEATVFVIQYLQFKKLPGQIPSLKETAISTTDYLRRINLFRNQGGN